MSDLLIDVAWWGFGHKSAAAKMLKSAFGFCETASFGLSINTS